MTDEPESTIPHPEKCDHISVPELPERVLQTYSRLWQFEIWLRRLVYVELRSLMGDNWEQKIRGAEGPRKADKRLTHMPTVEDDPLSYAQFSELCRIILDDWRLFEPFLPPKSIWDAKLEEISQIRHRVAHFRRGHHDDLQRVVQFLRDIDKGFWHFCTSYNHPSPVLPPSDDPVVSHFLDLDLFPWSKLMDGKWARIGIADPEARFTVTIEVLCRPWATWSTPAAGKEGLLYDVMIYARHLRHLDYDRFLDKTLGLHSHIVHICLDSGANSIHFTVPACLGKELPIQIIQAFYDAAHYCLFPGLSEVSSEKVQALADSFPEYILGPENPLSFLTPEMPCSFFGV